MGLAIELGSPAQPSPSASVLVSIPGRGADIGHEDMRRGGNYSSDTNAQIRFKGSSVRNCSGNFS